MRRRPLRHLASGLALICVVASCSTSLGNPGNAETDRIAATVATAISFPRQTSADGFVRAALATRAGGDGRLMVIEAEELHARQLVEPLGRLVFRVHLASSAGFSLSEPVTACYQAMFSFYGVIGSPHRISCPAGATPIAPTPIPPTAPVVLPTGSDGALEKLLAALPPAPSATDVKARVTAGLPAPGTDATTGLPDVTPTVESAVNGADVGVSLWAPFDRSCLLGARIGGQVTVWSPRRPSLHAGDLPPCDPQSALQLFGVIQPH
jgi:hypothetical protein